MGSCIRCNRPLKDPESVRKGMGKICAAKSNAERERAERDNEPMFLEGNPREVGVMIKRMPNGRLATNIPRMLIHHSPTGFEIGYGGSGPADFALNIMNIFFPIKTEEETATLWDKQRCSRKAFALHQEFKFTFLQQKLNMGEQMNIPAKQITDWIHEQLKNVNQAA